MSAEAPESTLPGPLREALLVAALQGIVIAVAGTGAAVLFVAGAVLPYILAVRWADPLQLSRADAMDFLGRLAILLVPLLFLEPMAWASLVGLSALGVGASRIQVFPGVVDADTVGVEAHLRRVRERGEKRSEGKAERANLAPIEADPLAGLFGGGTVVQPTEDPYADAQSVYVDPERDL